MTSEQHQLVIGNALLAALQTIIINQHAIMKAQALNGPEIMRAEAKRVIESQGMLLGQLAKTMQLIAKRDAEIERARPAAILVPGANQ
jgi:hypothetical protein